MGGGVPLCNRHSSLRGKHNDEWSSTAESMPQMSEVVRKGYFDHYSVTQKLPATAKCYLRFDLNAAISQSVGRRRRRLARDK